MLPNPAPLHSTRTAVLALLSFTIPLGLVVFISQQRARQDPFSSWRLDFRAPSIAITAPATGATVSGTIAVEVAADDDHGASLVKLYKDGVLLGQDALPPFTILWSTALEPNGSYTLSAVAIDSASNQASSQPVQVVVNNPPVTTRPNIVIVITDDQRWDTMQYMPLTNSLLYADSIRFTSAIAPVPLCCPSRSSLFTGLYAHNHGITDNMAPYGGAQVFRDFGGDTATIAVWLDRAGYQTGLFGKYLNSYDKIAPYIPPGWDQWFAFLNNNGNYYNYNLVENGVNQAYGNQPDDYSTTVLAEKVSQFIASAAPAEPVFVYFAPFAPHSTEGWFYSYPTPGPGDAGSFADLVPWRPASYDEADVSDKPRWVQKLARLSPDEMATGDQFRIKQIESLQAVDRAVEKLVEALVNSERYENTVFVFLSDNGLSWGEHRWNVKKWCAYEECIRIPFWMRVPGKAGREDISLVSDVDLAPTLAEFAGAFPEGPLNGLSLVDLIENPFASWRTEAYTEYISPAFGGNQMIFRAIRTSTQFYAEYDNGDREFYDLSIDPLEEINRVDHPGYAQTISSLRRALFTLKEQ